MARTERGVDERQAVATVDPAVEGRAADAADADGRAADAEAPRAAAVGRVSPTTFPVVAALEALDAWLRNPTDDRRQWLAEAVAAIVSAAGAKGAWLEVEAAPLPGFSTGFGTIVERPSAARSPGLRRFEIHAEVDHRSIGRVWLDAPAHGAELAVRALELALDAAWSRAEVVQTADRLQALNAATQAIAGVLSVEGVLQLIVDRVRGLVGAQYAALGIVDEYGLIERFVTSGIDEETRDRLGAPPRGHGLLGLIIREGRSYRIPDIADHPDRSGFPPGHPEMRSFLGVPIRVKGRAIGNLYLTEKAGAEEFSEADQRLVEMFALHAGIAMENARLHERVQRLAVVEERERIGRDLHDGIIQSLYAVSLSLEDVGEMLPESPDESVRRIDRAIDALNVTIRDIRNFIFGLRPELLEGSDVVGSLAGLAEEVRLNTMIDTETVLDPVAADALPATAGPELIQVAREALSNVARHSKATHATVELRSDGRDVIVVVADNGVGFDPDEPRDPSHQGLPNMRARIDGIGGRLFIDSEPGSGARIIVRVPRSDVGADATERVT